MNNKPKARYPFLEGITDWLTAYMLGGVLVSMLGMGGLWLLIGSVIVLMVILAFSVNFPKTKFKIYAFGLAVYFAYLISQSITTGNQTLSIPWVLMIVLGLTQAILTVHYYQNKLKK